MTFIYSAFAVVMYLVLLRVLVALQQMSANSLLIKFLCKYSASLNIKQQREPLPPF